MKETRTKRLTEEFLRDVPPAEQEEAMTALRGTAAYQQAALTDSFEALGRAMEASLPGFIRRWLRLTA